MTPLCYLGVDPGATGALAVVDHTGDLLWVEDMPNPLHGAIIADLLENEKVVAAAVEDVHAMPGQGVSSTFRFGQSHGVVLGALGALFIPYQLVSPFRWKKTMRVTADKDLARQRAIETWPTRQSRFARKKDHGRAEAALIALWCLQQTAGVAA